MPADTVTLDAGLHQHVIEIEDARFLLDFEISVLHWPAEFNISALHWPATKDKKMRVALARS